MTPLTSFRKRTFLVAVKGSLRRASTPLTEDFQVTNRSSHSIDIKRGKKGYVETMIYLDNSNQRWLLSNRIRLLKRKEQWTNTSNRLIETGEVMQGCMVYIPYRPRLTERWFMAFQDTFIEIAKDPDMTGETMKVLMYLFGKLDFENFIQQTQIDVAEGLGMKTKC